MEIAVWLAAESDVQIALGRFVLSEADDEQVSLFAHKLIDDHETLMAQLRRVAPLRPPAQTGAAGAGVRRAPSAPAGSLEDPLRVEGATSADRRRVLRGTSPESRPKDSLERGEEPTALPLTERGTPNGQETGPTGARQRDVRQGETGGDLARQGRGRLPAGSAADRALSPNNQRLGPPPSPLPDQATVRPPGPGGLDITRVMPAISQRKLALARRELEMESGEWFDQAYLQIVMAAHAEMLATVQTLSAYASADLREILLGAEKSVQRHMIETRRILDELGSPVAELQAVPE
jgi:predicted outer membrane protein